MALQQAKKKEEPSILQNAQPSPGFLAEKQGLDAGVESAKKELAQLKSQYAVLKQAVPLGMRYSSRNEEHGEYALDAVVEKAEKMIGQYGKAPFDKGGDREKLAELISLEVNGAKTALYNWFDIATRQGSYTVEGRSFFDDTFKGGTSVSEADATSEILQRIANKGQDYREFVFSFLDFKASLLFDPCMLSSFFTDSQASYFKKASAAYGKLYGAKSERSIPLRIARSCEVIQDLQEKAAAYLGRLANEEKATELWGGVKINENLRQDLAGWLDLTATMGAVWLGRYGGQAGLAFEKSYFSWKAAQEMEQGQALSGAVLLTALWGGKLSAMYKGYSAGTSAASASFAIAGFGAGAYLSGSMAKGIYGSAKDLEQFGFSQEALRSLAENGIFIYLGAKGMAESKKAMANGKNSGKLSESDKAQKKAAGRAMAEKREADNLGQKADELGRNTDFLSKITGSESKRKLAKAQEILAGMAQADRENGKNSVMEFLAGPGLSGGQFVFYMKILVEKGFLDPNTMRHLSDAGESEALQQYMRQLPGMLGSFEAFNSMISAYGDQGTFTFKDILAHRAEISRLANGNQSKAAPLEKPFEQMTGTERIEWAKKDQANATTLIVLAQGQKGYFQKSEVPALLDFAKSSFNGFILLAEAFKADPGLFSAKDISELIKISYEGTDIGGRIFSGNPLTVKRLSEALIPNHAALDPDHVRLLSEAASFNPQFLDLLKSLRKAETRPGMQAVYDEVIARHLDLPRN